MADEVYVDMSEVARFGVDVAAHGLKAGAAMTAITRKFTGLLVTRIQARASSATHAPGQPHIGGYGGEGPNVATGDYRRSWQASYGMDTFGFYGMAATNRPQAMRLEYGFVGTDAAGRHYDQKPLPHVGPAYDQTAPEYLEAMATAAIEGL